MDAWGMFRQGVEVWGMPTAMLLAVCVCMFFLIRWVLIKNSEREEKYLEVISTLSKDVGERLAIIEAKID